MARTVTKYYFARPATVHGSLLLQVQKLDDDSCQVDILYDIERRFHPSFQWFKDTLRPSSPSQTVDHHLHHFVDMVIVDRNSDHPVSIISEAQKIKFSNHRHLFSASKELEVIRESPTEFSIPELGKWIKQRSPASNKDPDPLHPTKRSATAADLYFSTSGESKHHNLYINSYNTNNNPFFPLTSGQKTANNNQIWNFKTNDTNQEVASLTGFELSVYEDNEALTTQIIATTVCLLMNIINENDNNYTKAEKSEDKSKKISLPKPAFLMKLLHA